MQLIKDQFIAFDQFGCRKTNRKVIVTGMILDQMGDSVKASVDGASVIILIAIIPAYRALLIVSHMDGMPDQLFDSFTAGCRDRNDRNSQECLQVIDPDGAPVSPHLIHHIEGDDHRYIHLQQLHGEVEISLDVGGVQNINDRFGLLVQDEVAGNQLFTAVRGHRVDAGQVRHQGVGMIADGSVLAADGNPGEIAHMLIGTCQLIEECCLTGVLISYQGKCQQCIFWQGIPVSRMMEAAFFSEAGMLCL